MIPPRTPEYPRLPSRLRTQLEAITPSTDGGLAYYPCLVTLKNGTLRDPVYLVSQAPWIKVWGLYPNQDLGKSEVLVEDVLSIVESPSRLPASFASELYRAGESGMGYMVFTVVFRRTIPFLRRRKSYVTGGAVDFIHYPLGKGPKDVVSVLPHVGRRVLNEPSPRYYWCLYSE